MIQRRHLELIAALSESETLVQAAGQLHLTPSALSHQLRELEAQLDLSLVKRRQKPLKLTPVGARVLDTARDVLPRLRQLEADLRRVRSGEGGRLHLAIECHSCYMWLMPSVDRYRQDWPAVELDIAGGLAFEGLAALQAGDVDLLITADPEPLAGISYTPLFDYECVLTLPHGHPLAAAARIEAADLRDQTLIVYPVPQRKLDVFRQFLHPAGVEPRRLRTSEMTVMMMALVAGGRGLCALPNWAAEEYTARDYVIARRLGSGVFNTLYAAVREVELAQPWMRDFLLLAKDMPFEHLTGIARPVGAQPGAD